MYSLISLRNAIGWKKWKYNDDYNDIDNNNDDVKNVCNDYDDDNDDDDDDVDGDDDQSDNDDDDADDKWIELLNSKSAKMLVPVTRSEQ